MARRPQQDEQVPAFFDQALQEYLQKNAGKVSVAELKAVSANQKGGESGVKSGQTETKKQRQARQRAEAQAQSQAERQSDNPEPIGDAANRVRDRVKQRIFESVPQAIRTITELMVLFTFFEAHPEAAKVALTNIDVLVYPFIAGWMAEHVGSLATWMTALALSSVSPKWQNVAEGVATGWKNRQSVTQEEADRIGESSKSTQEAMLRFLLYYVWKMVVAPAAIYGTEVAVLSTAMTPGALEKIIQDLVRGGIDFGNFWESTVGQLIPDLGSRSAVPEMAPQSVPSETAGPVQEVVDRAQNTELWSNVAKWTGGIVGTLLTGAVAGAAGFYGVIRPGARALAASRRAVGDKFDQFAFSRVRSVDEESIASEVLIRRVDVDEKIQNDALHYYLARKVGDDEALVNRDLVLFELLRDAIRVAGIEDERERLQTDSEAAFRQLMLYVSEDDLRDLFAFLKITGKIDPNFSHKNLFFQRAFKRVSQS